MREPGLFHLHSLRDAIGGFVQLGIRITHQVSHRKNHLVEERFCLPQQTTVRNRAPDNLPQHVAASLIGRQHAIGYKKRCSPRMISNDAQGSGSLMARRCCRASLGLDNPRGARQLRRALDQWRKQIGLIIRNHALQHRRYALQSHAGIDRRLRQWGELAGRIAVKLHEYQIPDLHIAPAIASELAIGMALIRRDRAHVVMNLAAGPARTGIAHLPEIVFQAHLVDTLFGDALPEPQVISLGVPRNPVFPLEDGHVQLVFWNSKP